MGFCVIIVGELIIIRRFLELDIAEMPNNNYFFIGGNINEQKICLYVQ